jgi:hypothetical protein
MAIHADLTLERDTIPQCRGGLTWVSPAPPLT